MLRRTYIKHLRLLSLTLLGLLAAVAVSASPAQAGANLYTGQAL